MTRKELDRYFSDPMFETLREDLKKIMDSHPELTDKTTIELAADKMDECRGDGVEISVDNALRLVRGKRIPSTEELVKSLREDGVTADDIDDIAESLLNMETPHPTGAPPKESAKTKAKILAKYAEILTNENKDIVLLGLPDIDPGWDFAQLKLAFFGEDLTDKQKTILANMKHFADEVKYIENSGYAEVIFYINEL